MMEWKSFGNEDIIAGFRELGHEVITMPFSKEEVHHDEKKKKHLLHPFRNTLLTLCFPSTIFLSSPLPVKKQI